jgi:hypothetical protein
MVTSTVSYGPGALPVIGPNAWSDALDTETEVEAAIVRVLFCWYFVSDFSLQVDVPPCNQGSWCQVDQFGPFESIRAVLA